MEATLTHLSESEMLRLAKVATRGKDAWGRVIWYRKHLPGVRFARWQDSICRVRSTTTPGKYYTVRYALDHNWVARLVCDCPSRKPCIHLTFATVERMSPFVTDEQVAAVRAERLAA